MCKSCSKPAPVFENFLSETESEKICWECQLMLIAAVSNDEYANSVASIAKQI